MTNRKQGKSIRIFLADGDPNGLRIAELFNWTGQAVVIPRKRVAAAMQRPDCRRTSVYFLVGEENGKSSSATVYIGETDDLAERLKDHNKKKEFWGSVVGISNKDLNLTKTHVMYLESKCIEIVKDAGIFELDNERDKKPPELSETDEACMEEFLENMKILLVSIGYPILEELEPKASEEPVQEQAKEEADPLVHCRSPAKGVEADGRWTDTGLIVYKGSKAIKENAEPTEDKNARRAKKLLADGFIKDNEKYYEFIRDKSFDSPSGASSFILGENSNGWFAWKTKDGKTLNEIYRIGLDDEAEQGNSDTEDD